MKIDSPIRMNEIVGQSLAKLGLLSIVKYKEVSSIPKWIVIAGPKGTGRRSLVKNYIRSLYCENRLSDNSNCGECEACKTILNDSTIYREYDYSEIENIEFAKYNIITNFELCDRETQVKLFDIWNKKGNNSSIIIVTEDTDKLIDSINMISFILRTSLLSIEEIEERLLLLKERDNSNITKDNIEIISRRCRGQLFYAYKMYNNYRYLDQEAFKESIMSAREYYIAFLISCYRNNRSDIEKYLYKLKTIPLTYLKIDYESLIVEILKVYTKFEKPRDQLIDILVRESKNKILDLYYILNDRIIYDSFQNEDTFQSAMYVIYLKLIEKLR